jgi:hypothetical protein
MRSIQMAVAALLVLICSCMESREELWIESTGAGKARITVSVPTSIVHLNGGASGVPARIDAFFAPIDTVHDVKTQITEGAKRTTIDVSFQFRSAVQLRKVLDEHSHETLPFPAIRHLVGALSIHRDGIEWIAERTVDVAKALPGARLVAAQDNSNRLITILHLPLAAAEHNATHSSNKGRTLIWDMPLSTALRAPYVQRVTVAPATPLLTAVAIITPALLATIALFWRRKQTRSSHNQLGLNQEPIGAVEPD